MLMRIGDLAYARSGDKGDHVNIGVIAYDSSGYQVLKQSLTPDKVGEYFKALSPSKVVRYELPNLNALNFILYNVLEGGGTQSLRIDAQGKALGQALLEMHMEIT